MSEWITADLRERLLELSRKDVTLLFDSEIKKWLGKKGSKSGCITSDNLKDFLQGKHIENKYAEEIALAVENKDKLPDYNFEYFIKNIVDRIEANKQKSKKLPKLKQKKKAKEQKETQIHWLDYIQLTHK